MNEPALTEPDIRSKFLAATIHLAGSNSGTLISLGATL